MQFKQADSICQGAASVFAKGVKIGRKRFRRCVVTKSDVSRGCPWRTAWVWDVTPPGRCHGTGCATVRDVEPALTSLGVFEAVELDAGKEGDRRQLRVNLLLFLKNKKKKRKTKTTREGEESVFSEKAKHSCELNEGRGRQAAPAGSLTTFLTPLPPGPYWETSASTNTCVAIYRRRKQNSHAGT